MDISAAGSQRLDNHYFQEIYFFQVAASEDLHCITDPARAAEILHPLRLEILRLAGEPISASELAPRLKLSRQRVNYHVRRLARGGFLRRAGQRRRRNMIEQRYVASARAFLLSRTFWEPSAPTGDAWETRRARSIRWRSAARWSPT
jgi:DNA-binding transcriptional ArsR family regulator